MGLGMPRIQKSKRDNMNYERNFQKICFNILFYDPVSVTVHSLTLFKLNEPAGTRGHPFKSHKKTVSYSTINYDLTNQYAHIFINTFFK